MLPAPLFHGGCWRKDAPCTRLAGESGRRRLAFRRTQKFIIRLGSLPGSEEAGIMDLAIKRVVIFTADMVRMATFYHDVIGLDQMRDETGFVEFRAGGCNVALHKGTSEIGRRPPKLVFFCEDVAAARELLVKRGAKLGKLKSKNGLDLCEGRDPDGNPFQISNRT
jgi:predicted enzyme related to lactoylglutathione lyase